MRFDCGNQQLLTIAPFISTAQAPHSPSRTLLSCRSIQLFAQDVKQPRYGIGMETPEFTVDVHSIPILLTISTTRASFLRHRFHQHLWRRGNFAQTYTSRSQWRSGSPAQGRPSAARRCLGSAGPKAYGCSSKKTRMGECPQQSAMM